jgi:hypothetical protein
MPKPTIIIGIGTSGLRVVEQVQNFYYENTGRNKPDHVEYFYLETDENSYPGVTALKNEIKRVYLDLREKETMINAIKKDGRLDGYWLPPAAETGDNEAGAGGWPAFGRAALWGHQNFTQVAQSISTAYTNVGNIEVKDTDDSKPAVFIVGSLTGGTGSGVFIDLAYMVRNLITDIDDVFGLFLIPGLGKEGGTAGKETIYCNTFAALKSLDYFTGKKNGARYQLNYPNGSSAKFEKSPYKLAQIISQDYDGPVPSIGTLDGLYKMAGLYLFLNIYGLREKRMRRLVDAWGNDQMGKYGTFGLSAIQYPKAQLEEFLAVELSMELLQRWIDPNMYYAQGNKVQMNEARTIIRKETFTYFEKLLREAFDILNTVEVEKGRQIINDLPRQARKINAKEHGEESDYLYIWKLFSSQQSGQYYEAIRNNAQKARDIIITGIHDLVARSVNQYENLYLAHTQLQIIVEAINYCLNYWKSLKLSGQPAKWEAMLDQQIKWMLKKRYKSVFEQNNVLTDRMQNTLELLKMHLVVHKLVDVRKNIVEGDFALATFDTNVELPRLKNMEEIIAIIGRTLGKEERQKGDKQLNVLRARRNEILDDLRDTSIPILRVYPSNDLKYEVEKSKLRYMQGSGKSLPSKNDVIGEQASLWAYLNQAKDTLNKMLYFTCISQFEREVRKHNSVEDMVISMYVEKEPKEAQRIASRALNALVKINPDQATTFSDHMNIPKLVIGPDQPTINRVVEKFTDDMNFHGFSKDENGVLVIPGLKNILVFYAEKGLMNNNQLFNPTQHLRYIDNLRELYDDTPKQRGRSPQEWHIIRMPYLKFSKEEIR